MNHDDLDERLESAKRRWSLTLVRQIADTATSTVFWAGRLDQPATALKILKPYGADEIRGAELMRWYGGAGAARILDLHADMILMEWLDQSPLGDLVRARHDRDREASDVLCDVVLQLHRPRPDPPHALASLHERFQTLFETRPDFWPPSHRSHFARACEIGIELLATATSAMPLHGDFHHDNVIGSSRGWLAIDPKGLLGDPAYEMSNVFRNPFGAAELAVRPPRIDALADLFALRLGFERKRVLSWAAAHSALSACWDSAAGNSTQFDLRLLPRLIMAVDRA